MGLSLSFPCLLAYCLSYHFNLEDDALGIQDQIKMGETIVGAKICLFKQLASNILTYTI